MICITMSILYIQFNKSLFKHFLTYCLPLLPGFLSQLAHSNPKYKTRDSEHIFMYEDLVERIFLETNRRCLQSTAFNHNSLFT